MPGFDLSTGETVLGSYVLRPSRTSSLSAASWGITMTLGTDFCSSHRTMGMMTARRATPAIPKRYTMGSDGSFAMMSVASWKGLGDGFQPWRGGIPTPSRTLPQTSCHGVRHVTGVQTQASTPCQSAFHLWEGNEQPRRGLGGRTPHGPGPTDTRKRVARDGGKLF